MDWSAIKFLFLDVDGVLTDGRVALDAGQETHKAFCVQDGAAVQRWQAGGGTVALLSGRSSPIVDRRARELGIRFVRQGLVDKEAAYLQVLAEVGGRDLEAACVGDDVADMPVMRRCGWSAAPANALPAVKRVASHVTRRSGGRGAVAEVIDLLLRKRGLPQGPDHREDRC